MLSHKFKNANIISIDEEIDRNIINTNNIIIDCVIKKATEFELTTDFIESSKKDNTIFIVPILIYVKEYISKLQKLYITILSLRIEEILGIEIKSANIIYGQSLKKQKVNLSAHKKEASEI